jgi:hypothetical protein
LPEKAYLPWKAMSELVPVAAGPVFGLFAIGGGAAEGQLLAARQADGGDGVLDALVGDGAGDGGRHRAQAENEGRGSDEPEGSQSSQPLWGGCEHDQPLCCEQGEQRLSLTFDPTYRCDLRH